MDLFSQRITVPQKNVKGKIVLRDYQQDIVDAIDKHIRKPLSRIMCCLPTGGGKTIVFSFIAKEYQKLGKRVLVLTHRKELLMQSDGTFSKFGINAHNLTAESTEIPSSDIVVGMVETLYRRLENKDGYIDFVNSIDLVIIDEAHIGQFDKLFKYFKNIPAVLGVSATPYRRNPQTPLSSFYHVMVQGPDVKSLIQAGYLSEAIVYGQRIDLSNVGMRSGDYRAEDLEAEFTAQNLYSSLLEQHQKIVKGKKTLIFTPTVASAIEVAARFRELGIHAEYVHAETPKSERRKIFKRFKEVDDMILVNQGITTLGFDEPSIEVVVLFRATRSLQLYLQMIGRGSRVIEDFKDSFIILDFGNNTSRFGFYDDDREWSLENDTTNFKKETTMTKICPQCNAIVPLAKVTCACGYVWTKQRKEQLIEEIKIELIPLKGFAVEEYALGKSFEELQAIQEVKGYKKNWIFHQLQSEADLRMYGKFMGYKHGWIGHALKSFNPKTIEEKKRDYEAFINNLKHR